MNREPRWAIVRGVPKSPIGLSDSTCTHGLYGLRRCTSAVERSYPLSEVRGSSPDFQAATAQEQPRGATPAQGQGRWLGGATQGLRPGVEAGRSYPTPEVRGSGQEEQSHIQGAVAVWAQEGLQELSHIEGQEEQQ